MIENDFLLNFDLDGERGITNRMFVTTYDRLNRTEQQMLFETIFANGTFTNMLDMHLHLASRTFHHGASVFVALKTGRISGLAGVITKHTTKTGELCIPLLEMVPTTESAFETLMDTVVRAFQALQPRSLKIGLSPHAAHLKQLLSRQGFRLADRALELERVLEAEGTTVAMDPSADAFKPTGHIQFVPLSEAEPERFQYVYNRAFADSSHMFPLDADDMVEKKALSGLNPGMVGIVKVGDADAAVYELELKEECGWIETIAVLPEYRRMKIGTHILEHAFDIFRSHNRSTARLRVYENNDEAMAFYARHQFTISDVHSLWYVREIRTSLRGGIRRGRKVKK
jgi:GNAT superfamily N-acetyltransferase